MYLFVVLNAGAESKVNQLGTEPLIQNYILKFDVSVGNVLLVEVLECFSYFPKNLLAAFL